MPQASSFYLVLGYFVFFGIGKYARILYGIRGHRCTPGRFDTSNRWYSKHLHSLVVLLVPSNTVALYVVDTVL
ncbi:hypothetical protein H4K35_06675 [Myroides sp. NP-2]|uniref:hypothetical protein n=1 Tax=Myroides sp. NP-2 TaxID=2759945 RepID=UPI0015F98B3B|nr:hypothetical protein [Myroides sp. NP-2]MBB1149818.1 hypothetical protein [Myroides sp. NP-2]